MEVRTTSRLADAGERSAAVSMSTTSAQSAAYTSRYLIVSPTVDCFFRAGSNPTALSDGTDQFLFGSNSYRIEGLGAGEKLAFILASGTGTVYITPEP